MRNDKCRTEMMKVMDRKDLTKFMKLKAVRRADIVGFSRFLSSILTDTNKRKLVEMIAAGSYKEAMHVAVMTYDQCYTFISECYDAIESYVKDHGDDTPEATMDDVVLLLKSGGNQFFVLRKLYTEYDKLFAQLLNEIPMRQVTKEKSLAFLEYNTMEDAIAAVDCSRGTVISCTSRLYHMLLDAVDRYHGSDGYSFADKLDLLDTRSRTVVCREQCKSIEDVRAMLKREHVAGLGVACREKIQLWLKEVDT